MRIHNIKPTTHRIPAPQGDAELAQEWRLAQKALAWREQNFGIRSDAPIDRAGMDELVNAYLAMA